jgi:branched-chain amino acid transport system permease protein
MEYLVHLVILATIYLTLVLSLNLLLGYAGLLAVGHVGFYCLGAYVFTLLFTNTGAGFIPALVLGVVACTAVGLVVGIPALRLRGDYFVLASLAFLVVVYAATYNWVSLTRGPYGITAIPRPRFGLVTLDSSIAFLACAAFFALISVAVLALLGRSPFGRALKAIRENEIAAQSLGKNTPRLKVLAFGIAGGIAAVAGALYASYMSYIDPTAFYIDQTILVLSMALIGGAGNIKGPVVGTLVVLMFPEVLRFLHVPEMVAPQIRQIIFGLAIVLLMRYRPNGLAGEYRFE